MSGAPILFRLTDKHYKIVGLHRGKPVEEDDFNNGIFFNYSLFLRVQYWITNKTSHPEKDVAVDFSNP